MRSFWAVALRILLVFGVFMLLQFWIPYYLLLGGGLVAGFFMLKTSDDRALALGLLIGSAVFGVYAWVIENYFK